MLTFQSATSDRALIPIDLQNVFFRSQKLPKDITSIAGFQQSIGGKQASVQKSANGTLVGDASKKIRRVDVRFKFKGFASVRESTVTLSGSVPWEMMYRVLVRLVPEVKSLKFKITNTAVRFYLKKVVRIENIGRQKIKVPGVVTIRYEPELYFAKLTIKFSDGIVVSVFANGTVVAQGRDLTGIENRVRSLLEKFKDPYGANIRRAPVAARKNLSKKRMNMIEARYERAKNWTNSRDGYYVRPGPNKVARFYEIPKNPALVRQKVIRAYSNVGVNVPPLTRRILGISGSVAPPPARRKAGKATNWDASPPVGMYIRPGPGGLPKFYKVPKLLKQGKKTVVEAYRKAGVKIPNRVRTVFGISPSSSSSSTKVPSMLVNDRGVFKIGKLDCMRYKLADLHKFAMQKRIPITKKQKKADICMALRGSGRSPSSAVSKPNFVKNGVKHYVLANERRVKRNKHTKAMDSFKVQELKNMILAINATSNVSKKTKKQLVDLLIERKRTKNIGNALFFNMSVSSKASALSQSNRTGPSSQTRGSGSLSSDTSLSPARSGLNIARNVLGPGFTNVELQNFLNKYQKSPARLNAIVAEFKGKKLRKLANAPVESL